MPQFSVLSFRASDKSYYDPKGTPHYICTYFRPTSFLGSFICTRSLPLGWGDKRPWKTSLSGFSYKNLSTVTTPSALELSEPTLFVARGFTTQCSPY